LTRHGQSQRAIDHFWGVVVVSACNARVDRVSARYAAQVFQEGFLEQALSYRMGLARTSLDALYRPAAKIIEQAGGAIHFGEAARRLVMANHQVTGIETSHATYQPDAVIASLPPDRLDQLIDEPVRAADARLAGLGELTHNPIVGIHLFIACDREPPVMDRPHLALVGSPLHWLFNKGVHLTPHGERVQYLHGVVSAADRWAGESKTAVRDQALAAAEQALGRSLAERLRHWRVIKEKRATFAAHAGVDRYRPATRGEVTNLYLAGDWVDTGWPATMEGAVRSGDAAARAVLADRGRSPAFAEPSPPRPDWPVRLLRHLKVVT
jgi:hypothetical protein